MTQDQENKIREEFDKKFPLPKILALSGGKGVERDLMIKFFLTKMKEQIEIAVREREGAKKIVVYFSKDQTYSELSHEDRLKLNAREGFIYLADSIDGVWGDDWNDAPDEHNSGSPYKETLKGGLVLEVKLGRVLSTSLKE